MIRMQTPAVGAACAILALGLSACGDSEGGSSDGAPRVALLTNLLDKSYTPYTADGIAESTGGEVQTFSANFDPQTQVEQCQDAITSQRFDAIVLTPVDKASALSCVKLADEAGIPVVVDQYAVGDDDNDLKPQVSGVVGSVLYTPEATAELYLSAVDSACAAVEGECDVVLEISSQGDPLFAAVLKEIQEKSGDGYNLVTYYESGFDPAKTTAKIRDIFTANSGIDVVLYSTDTTAVAAYSVIKDLGQEDDVSGVGFGASREGIKAVKDGRLVATLPSYPRSAGEAEGKMVVEHLEGGKVTDPGIDAYDLGPGVELFTKDNIGDFQGEWGPE